MSVGYPIGIFPTGIHVGGDGFVARQTPARWLRIEIRYQPIKVDR